MTKVFIDGREGTTGLRIYERLEARTDVELILLSNEERKNAKRRKEALNACDIAFLCLPDDAAREAVSMIGNDSVTVIDASTAHRTNPAWAYGFPELCEEFSEKLAKSKRIAVPGCHASGFAALVYPLVKSGILPPDSALSCFSITGYSGGGKKMIAAYEDELRNAALNAPRQYALSQAHKHLPEMKSVCGLAKAPVFCPVVADYYSGMETTVPLIADSLAPKTGVEDIKRIYKNLYGGPIMRYSEAADEGGFLSAAAFSGRDVMEVSVFGNGEQIVLVSRFDNLGKGASGAAVECMNIVLGKSPEFGLVL